MLDKLQSHFDHEVQAAFRKADQLASVFKEYAHGVSTDVRAIENLTRLNRMLADGLK